MRIYDSVIRNGKVSTNDGEIPIHSMGDAVPMDIQEVHDWWHSQPPGVQYNMADLGPCIPPFPKTFMEWRCPSVTPAEDIPQNTFAPTREGASITSTRLEDNEGWIVRMQPFAMTPEGQVRIEPEGCIVHANSDGIAHGYWRLAPTGNLTGEIIDDYDRRCAERLGIAVAVFTETRRQNTKEICFEASLACVFANCKNVELREEPKRHTTKAIRRRHGEPVQYRVIRLPYTGKRRPDGRAEIADDGAVPLHMVRGHFKTYTPEKPLFGRMTGTYWWAHHLRGDESAGVVHHDYEVGPV